MAIRLKFVDEWKDWLRRRVGEQTVRKGQSMSSTVSPDQGVRCRRRIGARHRGEVSSRCDSERGVFPDLLPVPVLTPWRGRVIPRSEEHTSELKSLMRISYALFCLKKKK